MTKSRLATGIVSNAEGRTMLEQSITEKAFCKTVIEIFKLAGFKVAHITQSRQEVVWTDEHSGERRSKWVGDSGTEGYPDLVCVKGDELLFAELKVGRNKATQKQQEWLQALDRIVNVTTVRTFQPVKVFLWYPDDIEDIKRIAGAR